MSEFFQSLTALTQSIQLADLTGAVLLVAVAGYTVDAVYQRLYRLLRLPALETKLDALTARILQNIVGSKEV